MDNVTPTWLEELHRYWRQHPPLHKIVAAFAGYKPPPESKPPSGPSDHRSSVEALRDLFPTGLIG